MIPGSYNYCDSNNWQGPNQKRRITGYSNEHGLKESQQIPQIIKKIMHADQIGFTARMQECFNFADQ